MQQPDEPASEAAALALAHLRAHPAFLAENPSLYGVLDPPVRVHGAPFADHMTAMLRHARSRTETAERDVAAAVAERRAADSFLRRVQEAVLAMMRTPNVSWFVSHDLPGLLHLDAARLCSESLRLPRGAAPVPRGTVAAALGQRTALVRAARPDALLHGEAVSLAAQEALIRIPLASGPALLALASRNPAGLAGATTDSLAFLGHALCAAMDRA